MHLNAVLEREEQIFLTETCRSAAAKGCLTRRFSTLKVNLIPCNRTPAKSFFPDFSCFTGFYFTNTYLGTQAGYIVRKAKYIYLRRSLAR